MLHIEYSPQRAIALVAKEYEEGEEEKGRKEKTIPNIDL